MRLRGVRICLALVASCASGSESPAGGGTPEPARASKADQPMPAELAPPSDPNPSDANPPEPEVGDPAPSDVDPLEQEPSDAPDPSDGPDPSDPGAAEPPDFP